MIGTGIAGLTCAHLLRARGELTVFEADTRIGGHVNTVAVDDPHGVRHVDTGFIVHNDRNYPLFTALLDELEIPSDEAEMGMSIAAPGGGFEFANTSRGLFAQRSNLVHPRFWRLIRDQLRFNREARAMIGRDDAPSVGEFLRDGGYSRWFVERVIAPEISAVWSADPEAIWEFPISFLAEFLSNHGQLGLRGRPRWRTISGGSHRYVDRLTRPFAARIRTGSPVTRVERLGGKVAVQAGDAPADLFDEVVIATHPDQALRMLTDPSVAEREVLGAFDYRPNEAVLHTDASLMPRRRRAWASWNFHLAAQRTGDPSPGTRVTYWMNNLQRLEAARDYFVTLNWRERVDPERVIEVIEYAHPQITHRSVAAQRRWEEISGAGPVHYCGAYWRWGFHEDGCWSGHRAAEAVGQRLAVSEPLSVAA